MLWPNPSLLGMDGWLLTGGIAVMANQVFFPGHGRCVGGAFEILFFNNWLNHGFLLPLGNAVGSCRRQFHPSFLEKIRTGFQDSGSLMH